LKGLFVLALTVAYFSQFVARSIGVSRKFRALDVLAAERLQRAGIDRPSVNQAIRNATALYLKSPHDASTLRAVEQIKKISTGRRNGSMAAASDSSRVHGTGARENQQLLDALAAEHSDTE